MNQVALGFHLVRVMRHASAKFALAAILAVAVAPIVSAAQYPGNGGFPEPAAMDGPTSQTVAYSLGDTTVRVRKNQPLYQF